MLFTPKSKMMGQLMATFPKLQNGQFNSDVRRDNNVLRQVAQYQPSLPAAPALPPQAVGPAGATPFATSTNPAIARIRARIRGF